MKDFGTYLWTKGPGVFVVCEEAPTYAFQASEFFNFNGGESFTSKLSSLASGERVDITGFGDADEATAFFALFDSYLEAMAEINDGHFHLA